MAGLVNWAVNKLNPAQPSLAYVVGEASPVNIVEWQKAFDEVDIIHRAMTMIVNGCAEIDYQITGGPEKKLNKLLNKRPNPFEDKVRFFRRAYLDFLIDGNAFFYYDKKDSDNGSFLYLLPANDVTIIPDTKTFVRSYEYTPKTSTQGTFSYFDTSSRKPKKEQNVIEFSPDEIIHIKADSTESIYRGDSALKSLEDIIELYYALVSFQRQFFKNNAIPGLVLTTENVLSKKIKERLLEDWVATHSSMFNGARSPAILDGGVKIDKFSNINFQELDFEKSIDRLQQDMSKALGVPYVLLKSGNNANIGNNQMLFYLHTVLPILNQFASAFELYFGPDIEVEPDKQSVSALRPDTKTEGQYVVSLVNGGIITPNEGREAVRFERIEDPEYDKLRIPQNIAGSAVDPSIGGRPPKADNDKEPKS